MAARLEGAGGLDRYYNGKIDGQGSSPALSRLTDSRRFCSPYAGRTLAASLVGAWDFSQAT